MFGDSEVSTTFAAANTGVAQLVEHRSPKPGVGSSSLSSRAKEKPQVIDDFLRLFSSIKNQVHPIYSHREYFLEHLTHIRVGTFISLRRNFHFTIKNVFFVNNRI